jgi:hypothetical protein
LLGIERGRNESCQVQEYLTYGTWPYGQSENLSLGTQ